MREKIGGKNDMSQIMEAKNVICQIIGVKNVMSHKMEAKNVMR